MNSISFDIWLPFIFIAKRLYRVESQGHIELRRMVNHYHSADLKERALVGMAAPEGIALPLPPPAFRPDGRAEPWLW
jgi:hypothetical protein